MESKKASVQREITISGKQKGKCTEGDSHQWKAKKASVQRETFAVSVMMTANVDKSKSSKVRPPKGAVHVVKGSRSRVMVVRALY